MRSIAVVIVLLILSGCALRVPGMPYSGHPSTVAMPEQAEGKN